jgi:hypothetical protein
VREVAQIGAALGRQFSHELIAAVASMPSRELDNALAQLVAAELIYRRGIPPDAEYSFKHALVQDAAYGPCCVAAGSSSTRILLPLSKASSRRLSRPSRRCSRTIARKAR